MLKIKTLSPILFSLILLLKFQNATAQTNIDSTFLKVPMSELPLLEHNPRLDMIDLYNYKMIAKGENIFGGTSVLTKKLRIVCL